MCNLQFQVQCSILKLGMCIIKKAKSRQHMTAAHFFIFMYYTFYVFFRYLLVIASSAFGVRVNMQRVVFLQPLATT